MGVYEDGREAAVASATASAPPTDRSALDWLLEPALEPAGLTETFTSSPATLRERRSSRDAYEFDLVAILSSIWPIRLPRLLLCLLSIGGGLHEVDEVLPSPPSARLVSRARARAASNCCFALGISTVTSDDRELLSGEGDVTHGAPNTFLTTHECALPQMERR